VEKKVCLILSGGAARCLAHIGVYKYLFRNGFEIVGVAGSSGGTVVGAFIAANYLPCQMENLASKIKPYRVLKPAVPPKSSLLSWKPVRRFFKHFLPRRFEELSIPLYASVTDLKTGENFLLTGSPFIPKPKEEQHPDLPTTVGKGNFVVVTNLIDAVSASAALPPFFEPVKIDGRLYADGAFTNDLPVEPFLGRKDCLKVCVDVTPIYPTEKLSGMLDYTVRAFVIGIRKHKEEKYHLCDAVIKPNLEGLSFINYTNPSPYVEKGFEAAQKVLAGI